MTSLYFGIVLLFLAKDLFRVARDEDFWIQLAVNTSGFVCISISAYLLNRYLHALVKAALQ